MTKRIGVIGRPPLPAGSAREGHIRVRTYKDVADKVARNGTEWLEVLVQCAPDGLGKRRARSARTNQTTEVSPVDDTQIRKK